MEGYRDACPEEVEAFQKEAKWLIVRLCQDLEDQFKEEVTVRGHMNQSRVVLGESSVLVFIDLFPHLWFVKEES